MRSSTRTRSAVPSPMPVTPVTPIVKPEGGQSRVLLLTSETALEAEVRDALRTRQQDGESALFFEFTYLDPALLFDFLAVLDLLDHVRHGYFDMIHIVPSASTWSRSRHSEHSQQPSPPLTIFSIGSLFTLSRRDREDQRGQSSAGRCSLGRGAGAPVPIKNHWSQYHFPRRLGRTLFTWSLFHMGTTGVSFS